VYAEGVTPPPTDAGDAMPAPREPAGRVDRIERPGCIEPVFVIPSCQHEHLFGVKKFFERVFAFVFPGGYLPPNKCSPLAVARGDVPRPRQGAGGRRATRRPDDPTRSVMAQVLSTKRKQILDCISEAVRERGYPPSVREIGESVGLTSSSTVHAHLAVLQREGYLRRDPTKPRAIEVCYDPSSKVIMDARPIRHVPLVGDVAAGTGVLAQENVEELYPLPEDFTGTGTLFMVTVRGDSMIDAGIMDGDFVVVRQQPQAEQGDIVVAGIPDGEATVKRFSTRDGKVVLLPANERLAPMEFDPSEVTVYGKVVTVLRRL
jgi:repressor LexA